MPAANPSPPSGLSWSLRAGLGAGWVSGLGFGLVDGLVAWRLGPALGALELFGCLAAAMLVYAGLHGLAGLALGALLHAPMAGRPLRSRAALVLGLLIAAGLFLEIYWWTRAYVYYGVPATDPRRLLAAAGMAVGALAVGLLAGRLAARMPAGAWRAVRATLAACAIAGGATLALAWRASNASSRGELNARNRELPNVLIFVVDALRQDTLGAYGHPRVKTPNVDRLAASGALFENAFVQAPYTWTSFGSLLTGKYPRRHGLVLMDPKVRMRLAENVTLPWHLKQAALADGGGRLQDGDYAGATFMTGTLSHGSGLMNGFDWYFEALVGHDLVSLDSRWSVFRSNLLISLIKNKLTQRLNNSLVTTTAVDWLRTNADKRFVGMVHLYSTHTPYDPEPEFRAQYCDPAYDGPVEAFYAEHRIALEQGKYEATPADVQQIQNLYLAGVAQADRDVGLVLDELERQGALDDTLVIFTSDHGEELSDHGLWEHNWMFQTNLRIPLILAWPNGPEWMRGKRVDAIVESIDVLPTVCDLLGLEPPESAGDPYREIDGRSLVPLLRGDADAVKPFSFAENGEFVSIQDQAWKLIVRAELLDDPGAFERACDGAGEPPRLFDLARDPDETRNALADAPHEAERLFRELEAWNRGMPIPRPLIGASARDREHAALMESLGYVGGTGDRSVLEQGEKGGAEDSGAEAQDGGAGAEDAGSR